jgi:hypothetical protein
VIKLNNGMVLAGYTHPAFIKGKIFHNYRLKTSRLGRIHILFPHTSSFRSKKIGNLEYGTKTKTKHI